MNFRVLVLAAMLGSSACVAAQTPTPQPVPVPSAPAPAQMPTPPPPALQATAWLLMDDASGQILAGENVDTRVEPASITKVMTSYVVAAEIANGKLKPDDEVTISENAWRGGGGGTDGSTSFLPLGSKVKLDDLLHGMIIQSGNDASIALAEHVAGSEDAFAALMNSHAQRLGLSDTHFVNSHGLSAPEHYTTAHDIARLSRALIRDFPQHYAAYSQKELTINGIKQYNRNTLLWRDESVDGIKTGHHSGAGYCLAASAKRGEQRLISVLMGSSGEKRRADDSYALLNWGFRFFETHSVYGANTPVAQPPLWKGETETLDLGLSEPLLVTVPRGRYEQLKAAMDVPKQLVAPIVKGQAIGTLRLSLDDKVIAERPLVALNDAPEGGFFKRISDGFWMWWEED